MKIYVNMEETDLVQEFAHNAVRALGGNAASSDASDDSSDDDSDVDDSDDFDESLPIGDPGSVNVTLLYKDKF